jgi:hypothetical protein
MEQKILHRLGKIKRHNELRRLDSAEYKEIRWNKILDQDIRKGLEVEILVAEMGAKVALKIISVGFFGKINL